MEQNQSQVQGGSNQPQQAPNVDSYSDAKERTRPQGLSGKDSHDLSESREKSYTHIVISKV